jgi:hypothetical protein
MQNIYFLNHKGRNRKLYEFNVYIMKFTNFASDKKSIFRVMKSLFFFLAVLLISTNIFGQSDKHDVILKLNGDELIGKITEITDTEVKFTYAGETLVYAIKKADILKITFSSGRIEIINKVPPPSSVSGAPTGNAINSQESHHNKVAILPFAFVRDGQSTIDELSTKAQTECFSYLSKHAGVFTIIEPRTSNALLIKAGVNSESIKGYTMDEICNLLGVEYVIDGLVTVDKKSTSSTGSSQYKSTPSNSGKPSGSTQKASAYSSSTSMENYQSSLTLNIYNDKGTSVFSQERKSFFTTVDAYKSALEYLLKRSPLYGK